MRKWWLRQVFASGRWRGAAADVVLWGCCAGLVAVEARDVRVAPVAEAAAVAVLLAAAFALRRRRPFTALGLALAALVAQAVAIALTPVTSLVMTYLVPCAVLAFSAGRRSERTAPVVAMVSTAALATLMAHALAWIRLGDARETLTGLTDWVGAVAILVAAVVAPWLLGRYWRRHAELRTAGWEIADRMERARDLDAERARLRERSRIATEMHDSLGHELALIAVRAAALEMAPEGDGTRGAAAELRSAAHGANLRLREIIGVLREDAEQAPDGDGARSAEDAAALVDRAVRAGLRVRLLREGPDLDPATPAGRAVHRVVQEALTNAARHAPGAAVTVALVREEGATTVRVSDTGGAASPRVAEPGGGSGLAGLRRLVEGMGGDFAAGVGGGLGGDDVPDPDVGAGAGVGLGVNAGGGVGADRGAGRGGDSAGGVGPHGRAGNGASGVGGHSARNMRGDTAHGAFERTHHPSGGPVGQRGFTVSARIPDTPGAPEPPSSDALPGTETAQRLRGARRSARRWLVTALAVPLVLASLIAAAGFGVLWFVGTNTVLPPEDYARLHVGQDRAAVERELPRFDYPADDLADPPPAPAGSACRYYLVEWENGLPPVYRLCFADGRLVDKDRIARR